MTARFQSLVDPGRGQVRFIVQNGSVRPSDAIDFRGMIISPLGEVYAVNDTGQSRVFQDGIAIEPDTGLTIVGPGPVVNTSMGGLGVNAAGCVVFGQTVDVVHQGVGLTNSGELILDLLQGFGENLDGSLGGLVNGIGEFGFARATEATVTDFEGLIRLAKVDELRFFGARRVENVLEYSEDITQPVWEEVAGAVANNADTLTLSETRYTGVKQSHTEDDASNVYRLSVDIELVSGDTDLHLQIDSDIQAITVSTTRKRYSMIGSLSGVGARPIYPVINRALTPSETIVTVSRVQLEKVNGQANQNPSEYVSTDVLSGTPYHGVNVDGVAQFNHENGNTVDGSGVVTEAKGAAITDWYALYEPPSINYADGDNDLSGGAEIVDLTTPGSGDYTLSVEGTAAVTVAAGTATGTGFGQATEGSPVTFNLTAGGTVTLTLNSGTLDKYEGLAVKQIEKLTVPTSWIPSSGGSVNRSADDGAPSYDFLNWSQQAGTVLAEVNFGALNTVNDQGILSVADSIVNVLHQKAVTVYSDDGTSFADVGLSPASAGNWFELAEMHSMGSTLDVGMRDITGAGAFVWNSPDVPYDGAFPTDSVINMFFGISEAPIKIRNLKIYKSRLGKAAIEAMS